MLDSCVCIISPDLWPQNEGGHYCTLMLIGVSGWLGCHEKCSCVLVAVERNFWASLLSGAGQGAAAPAWQSVPCPQAGGSNCTGAPSASHQDHDRWSSVQAHFLLLWLCLLSTLISHAAMKSGPSEGRFKLAPFYSLSCFCNWPEGVGYKGIWCLPLLWSAALINHCFRLLHTALEQNTVHDIFLYF